MHKGRYLIPIAGFLAVAVGFGLTAQMGLGAVQKAVGAYLGKSEEEIARTLESEGYDVEDFETEDGLIEVEANIGGVSYEIYVDPESGEIVSIKKDD